LLGSVVSWSDTQIVATVAANSANGYVKVGSYTGEVSNQIAFDFAPPVITSVSPTIAAPGEQVTVTGTGFGATQNWVYLGSLLGNVVSWSDTQIVATVAANSANGYVKVGSHTGELSNQIAFDFAPPVITSVSPTIAAPGEQVTVTGTGFGATQNWVYLGSLLGNVVSWSDTQIVATVTVNSTNGYVTVGSHTGEVSNHIAFTITPSPSITTVSPSSGGIGSSVTISGSYFGATQGTSTVSFNGTLATPTNWSDTSITVPVPTGATTGTVVVTVAGLAVSGGTFTVTQSSLPLLKLRINDSPGLVNLSDPANTDWIVWGADGSTPAATRASGVNLISDFSPINGAAVGEDLYSYVQFSWAGGSPIASETSDTPEVYVYGTANVGFQITVPADKTVKTLNIFTGVHGTAELDASISDGSSPIITDSSVSSLGETEKTYSIDFRAASAAQTLTVQLKLTDPNGYVDLRAATLQPHLPEVSITSPADEQVFNVGTDIPISATATQYDNPISSVQITDNAAQIFNLNASPYSTTFSGASPGHHELEAAATDNNELSGTSQQVSVDVVGSGGTLTMSLGQANGIVDLTAEGTADWKLFSPLNQNIGQSTITDSKANVVPQISDYIVLGNHTSSNLGTCGPDLFNFEDGNPDSSASNVNSCVYEDGLNNGFQFTVNADTTPRTLRVYLGTDYGVVKLQAYLSDGSATPIVDTSLNTQDPATDTVYTINYSAASASQKLTLRFTLDQQYDWGDLELYAATLAGPVQSATSPVIANVSPSSVAVGTPVSITGTNFGTNPGSVTFNTVLASGCSWSDTTIQCQIPQNANSGMVVVTTAVGLSSNGVPFTVVPPPQTTSLLPMSGIVGTTVTVSGANYGSQQGASTISFNGVTAIPISWSDTSITVQVPSGATTGNVIVNVNGLASNGIVFTVHSGEFVLTSGGMQSARYGQTATLLSNGQVLITGGMSSLAVSNSAELYNPTSQTFVEAGSMNVARWFHTATLLNDGTVLITGGSDLANQETLDSAEIYNPATGTFTLLPNTLNTARVGHTATLLSNGQVLIVGGYDPDFGLIADAELYDPATQTFFDLGDTNVPRYGHTATFLQNGEVLITGGETDPGASGANSTAELYDPLSQTFTPVPVPMTSPREGHAATLLNDGQVLITGGDNPSAGSLNSAEMYDPLSSTFTSIPSSMAVPRISHTMTMLNGGQVLITGGASHSDGSNIALNAAEIYDPSSQTFTSVSNMTSVREHQTETLLNDGRVLVVGGTDGSNIFQTAELFMPSQLNELTNITISPANPSSGSGTQQFFTAVGTFSDGSTQNLASVLWNSSNSGVASITNDTTNEGTLVGLAQGTTTITASAVNITGSTTLTITAPTLSSIQLSPQSPTIPLGTTQQFTVTGIYSDGSTQDLTSSASWSSPQSVVASINSNGLAAGLFQGVATIQVSYGSLSTTTILNVESAALVSLALNPSSTTIAVGTSSQYQAIGTYSDGSTLDVTPFLSWSSSSSNIASISTSGLVQSLIQGTTTITGTLDSVSASAQLTVGPPSLASLVISPSAASLIVGTTQQLTATGTYSDGSKQDLTALSTWATSNSNVAGIDGSGLATANAQGQVTVTATSGTVNGTASLIVSSTMSSASLGTSRYLHSATILDTGKILVAGGINCPSAGSCTYLGSAEIYDPVGNIFTATGAMAQPRSAPVVLLNNGNVLIAGGYQCNTSGNCSSLSSAEIYSPASGTFSGAGNMTTSRSDQTMTLLSDGTVLIAGGQNCTTATSCIALNSAEIYNPATGTFTATSTGMSAPRYGANAVMLSSGVVLIVGGFDGTNLPAAAETYNPTYKQFMGSGPNLNTPRFDASANLLNNGKVLIAGGSTCSLPGCPTASAEIYDPVANTFSVVGNMNVARFKHSATLLTNGQVVIAGGFSSCNSSCTSEASTELFDPVAGTFSSGQSVPNAVAGQTGTLTGNGDVLLIGGINSGVTVAGDQWYQPTTLTPSGLFSISVAPANLFLQPGQTQQLTATGTFNDGSTQTLQSVIWTSSNPSAALVSNSSGSFGLINAQATGSATITATTGNIGGSMSLNVASITSLTVTPANPSVAVGAGQQLTATVTLSDGSTQDVTSSATWSSSNNAVVIVGNTSGSQGLAIGIATGTTNVNATYANVSASSQFTVQNPIVINPPNIVSASPTLGEAGTQVTISGSGFGNTQGAGTVLLGTTYGAVTSWTDTQIVASVSPISQSGEVQVQQNGLTSNAVSFSINTATISNISPSSGLPGTQVIISGTGFGTTQGGGQIILGTTNGVVQSWSDNQIIAEVANGSTSGFARVLQNGIASNTVQFTVNLPQIITINPNSGNGGTSVTINGSGFGGGTQCGGGGGGVTGDVIRRQQTFGNSSVGELTQAPNNSFVWIGSTTGSVTSWCDTQIVATVAPAAVSGVVKVYANGIWSNAVGFTVPSGGTNITLSPSLISMVVGDTRTLQATDENGQILTGLSWSSSNTAVATLSTDDPPIITAIAAGNATITAGTASVDLTVYPGPTLPLGTTIWSNAGDGSGVLSVVPAVPNTEGIADVFVLNGDCNLQAVAGDGTTAWTVNIGQPPEFGSNTNTCNEFQPDFQGGVVVHRQTSFTDPDTGRLVFGYTLQKLDGLTGQGYPPYVYTSPWWTDLNFDQFGASNVETYSPTIVHPDGTIFVVDSGLYDFNGVLQGVGNRALVIDPLTGTTKGGSDVDPTGLPFADVGNWIIAGDGYAYLPYETGDFPPPNQFTNQCVPGVYHSYFRLLRIGTDGEMTFITLESHSFPLAANCASPFAYVPSEFAITNADQGVLISWETVTSSTGFSKDESKTYHLAITSGTSVIVQTTTPTLVTPVLQAQDGTFYGSTNAGMVHINQSGSITWTVPNDSPKFATDDGGLIGASGTMYDINGKANSYFSGIAPTESWTGSGYAGNSQIASTLPEYANSFAATKGGNPSSAAPSPQSLFAPAPSSGPYIPSLRSIFRTKIAELAKGYVGNSTRWKETSGTTCNLFVRDVLNEASDATSLNIPSPVRANLTWYERDSTHPFLAKDWANPTVPDKCWKTLPAGPDGSLPGDVIATGFPSTTPDATGHVGIVVEPDSGAPNYKDASAADIAPYWWTPAQDQGFIAGTITLTDYGFRLEGFDTTNPKDAQGLKKDSHVRRFSCY
jgi:uncharacterized protein YjdB/N-acetylneuraminic acid mutarotase